jgi:hypothetical protein
MRRHRSMLDDLATKMSGAGASAVVFGSGANYELRRREFEQFDCLAECELHLRAQCVRRSAPIADAQTNADQKPYANPDTDANVHASDERNGRNDVREQYGSVQRARYLRFCK